MGTKIFVGNISFDASEQDLRDLFSGDDRQVNSVAVIMDRETGRPRGFAFVEMGNTDDMNAAIKALDGAELHGRPLRVNEAEDKPRDGNRGGGGGGGGGGRRY